ncbi:TPA: hypothetical protein N0F65_003503 [Lagenidium giganteum]|uniref:FLYWCH-type domain-containing protein n=1 Tax=Lagenidium giganteum TaxID=4803 RepID=A0AAV2YMC5_9STRA|nr:TPA: hypothetical protein N0F65_003503 [Lagenidium giganteum]
MSASSVPALVTNAISNFQPGDGFDERPPRPSESSVISKRAVRVGTVVDGKVKVRWICLASHRCRENLTITLLSDGKTLRATQHLREGHTILSEKTECEMKKMREREDIARRLKPSVMYRIEPVQLRTLVEALHIINNILPFRLGEYPESQMLNDLAVRDQMQCS